MSYLVPQIVDSPVGNAAIVTLLPAILYTGAAYGQIFLNTSLAVKILVACIFAIMEYIVRVPINEYSLNVAKMSPASMQVLWIVLTLMLALFVKK